MPQSDAQLPLEQMFGQPTRIPFRPIAGGAADALLAEPATDAVVPDDDTEFTVSENDPLISLGLVDPKSGRALPTDDWHPEGAEPASPAPAGGVDWESPENPYKQRVEAGTNPVAQGQAFLRQEQAAIEARAQSAHAELVAKGVQDSVARVVVQSAAQAALAEARNQAEHIALGPQVRRHVAEDIARKFSTEGAKIDPTELMTYDGPEAMTAIAQKLQTDRRNARSTTRRQTGRDRAEGGSSAGATFDYSKLTSQQVIALGLRRGQ